MFKRILFYTLVGITVYMAYLSMAQAKPVVPRIQNGAIPVLCFNYEFAEKAFGGVIKRAYTVKTPITETFIIEYTLKGKISAFIHDPKTDSLCLMYTRKDEDV